MELDFGVELKASIDGLTQTLQQHHRNQRRLIQSIHPFAVSGVPMSVTGGAGAGTGTINLPQVHSPSIGQFWDVHRLTASGFTAGTVNVFLNSTAGDQVAAFTVAGSLFLGKGQLLLSANDGLVWQGVNLTVTTLTVQIAGIEIAAPLLGEYLL